MQVRLSWGEGFEIAVMIPNVVSPEDFLAVVDKLEFLIRRGQPRLSPSDIERALAEVEAARGMHEVGERPSIDRVYARVKQLEARTGRILELLERHEAILDTRH